MTDIMDLQYMSPVDLRLPDVFVMDHRSQHSSPGRYLNNREVLVANHESLRRVLNNPTRNSTSNQSMQNGMPDNAAAWLNEAKERPFQLKPAPMWQPEGGEILVRNKAIAINPIDGALQKFAMYPMAYPAILGHDIAGDVVATGPDVTRFKPGDRITGMAVGIGKDKRNCENAFQKYTILQSHMASKIPDGMPYEDAAVIPLGLSTAACGLFQEEPCLALQYPTEPRRPSTGKAILIWGGSSSVGANGIQLAVAAGYEVIATASSKNFGFVKKLGVSAVFDYNSPSVEEDLFKAFKGKQCVGALDCIGGQACASCVNVVRKVAGTSRVTTTKGGADNTEGVTVKRLFGTTLKDNGVGKAMFEDFLPDALKAGTYAAAPPPLVTGWGLESIQAAVDRLMAGVSAQKIVVAFD